MKNEKLVEILTPWHDGQGNPLNPSNPRHLSLPQVIEVDFDASTINGFTIKPEIALTRVAYEVWKTSSYGQESMVLEAELTRLSKGYISASHEQKDKTVPKGKIITGHYQTPEHFEENSYREFIDVIELITFIKNLNASGAKEKLIDFITQKIPSDRLESIAAYYRKAENLRTAMATFEPFLEDIKALNDKVIHGVVRLGLTQEQNSALVDTLKEYNHIGTGTIPAIMNGFIEVSPTRYTLQIAIKE